MFISRYHEEEKPSEPEFNPQEIEDNKVVFDLTNLIQQYRDQELADK